MSAVFAQLLSGQTEGRGSIAGAVRELTGAAVHGATVTITEETTGAVIEVKSNTLGVYASPLMVDGTYTVRAEREGFRAFERSGIVLWGGQVYQQDVLLQSVDISLSAQREARQSTVLNARDPDGEFDREPRESRPSRRRKLVRSMPRSKLDGQAATSDPAQTSPGGKFEFPDQDRTSATGEYRTDNGERSELEIRAARHAGEEPAVGVREVQASKIPTDTASIRTSQFAAYTGKLGTNEFHGAVYHFLGNDELNARGYFGNKSKARKNDFGIYVGGPIVKHKTFFAYHYNRLYVRSGAQSAFGNSTPIHALRQGAFGPLLSGRAVGVDVLGRAMYQGQIFDPASTRSAQAIPVRDPFVNNSIPESHPMRSRVAARVVPLMVQPQRSGLEFNVQGDPRGAQTWILDAPSHLLRLDHSFRENLRTNHVFSRTSHPAIRNCGGVGGCQVSSDPVSSPQGNANYYGEGFVEDITTHQARQRLDWIVANNLLTHATISYEEFHVIGHPLSAGAGWPLRLWGPGGNGLLEADAGPPAMSFTGNTRYSPLGNGWGRSGSLAKHRYQFGNDWTWIHDRHTVKIGGEYRHHRHPFRGWSNNIGGNFNFHRAHTGGFDAQGNNRPSTGDPFASFLLGQVNWTRFQIPDFPTIGEAYVAWSVIDEYRVTNNLTLTIGLRFDYQTAVRERDNNMSTFDPRVPNPGAGGRLGAMIFAGDGPGRTGSRTLELPPRDAFGPRIGFAYRLGRYNVIRGGYAIYYSGVPHRRFDAVNTLGFRSNPTANDLSNGLRPAYFLDDGFPPENVILPPSIDPAIGNNTSPVAITRDRVTLPRVQDWSFAIQRLVTRSMTLGLTYTGNRGSRLIADRRVLGPAANANSPEILSLGPSLLAVRADSHAAGSAGVPMPYRGFHRTVAQSLRPFPQMFNIGYMNVPAGNSFYHALRTKLEKRFSDGAHFQATYAWSKLTGMGTESVLYGDGLGQGPQNPIDTHSLERGLSTNDVPHQVLAAFTHPIPVFREKKVGLVARVLGGWAVAGIFRVEAGRPINIVMANDLGPFLFNGQKRPDILSSRVRMEYGGRFDVTTDSFFDRSAFADPGPLRFGNASRTMDFVRGFHNVAEDFSLFKDTWINEKFKLRFETQFGNIFNRVVFCDPNRNWSASTFGLTFAQCNTPRSIQFGLRLDF